MYNKFQICVQGHVYLFRNGGLITLLSINPGIPKAGQRKWAVSTYFY
jgi:hypothetical protein